MKPKVCGLCFTTSSGNTISLPKVRPPVPLSGLLVGLELHVSNRLKEHLGSGLFPPRFPLQPWPCCSVYECGFSSSPFTPPGKPAACLLQSSIYSSLFPGKALPDLQELGLESPQLITPNFSVCFSVSFPQHSVSFRKAGTGFSSSLSPRT